MNQPSDEAMNIDGSPIVLYWAVVVAISLLETLITSIKKALD